MINLIISSDPNETLHDIRKLLFALYRRCIDDPYTGWIAARLAMAVTALDEYNERTFTADEAEETREE